MPIQGWRGAELSAKATAASMVAIDATMAACVMDSKDTHPWQNETGLAESSIRISEFAARHGLTVSGKWGSVGVLYFIFLELGTVYMEPMPTLRPSADRHYPELRARMIAAWRGEAMW